jgi:hypothetical protein
VPCRESRQAGYPARPRSQHSAEETQGTLPPSPERITAPIPRTGYDGGRPFCPRRRPNASCYEALCLSSFYELRHCEQQWNAPHLAPPPRFRCSFVVYDDHAALEHLSDIFSPVAACRRALAVILDEHHRPPVTPDDTAHSACGNHCDRTTHRHTNCPPGSTPRPVGLRKEASPPPPAAPRGILRSHPAALAAGRARITPCHILQSV